MTGVDGGDCQTGATFKFLYLIWRSKFAISRSLYIHFSSQLSSFPALYMYMSVFWLSLYRFLAVIHLFSI